MVMAAIFESVSCRQQEVWRSEKGKWICVHMSVCARLWVINVHVCAWVCAHEHSRTWVCTWVWMSWGMWARPCIHEWLRTHVCVCECVNVLVSVHVCVLVHVCAWTCECACKCACVCTSACLCMSVWVCVHHYVSGYVWKSLSVLLPSTKWWELTSTFTCFSMQCVPPSNWKPVVSRTNNSGHYRSGFGAVWEE